MITQRNEDPIATLPNSLQQQFNRVQNLLNQSEDAYYDGDYSLAQRKHNEAYRCIESIARLSPEYGTLLVAGLMGRNGYVLEMVERVDAHQLVERKFLGLSLGQEVVNVPTITRRYIRARLL
ncbi:MAG: hypothetical protein EDM74_12920 [Armatimonadetes bacterium]|nr:MAG: hypothetical protein EDM74_12920 [Armatimonadota bacterium]